MTMDRARMEMRAVHARHKKNMSKDFFIMIPIHRAISLIGKTKLGAMSWNDSAGILPAITKCMPLQNASIFEHIY
jgi:hypothetical protein